MSTQRACSSPPLRHAARAPVGRRAASRARSPFAALALAAAVAFTGAAPRLHAQALPLVRDVPTAGSSACESVLPLAPSGVPRPAEAQRLAEAAAMRAVAGELTAARDELRRAVALDPSSGELHFQLGRAHDALGERQDALYAYCRAQHLTRDEDELAEVRQRIAQLATEQGRLPTEGAAVHFRTGVAYTESGNLAAAERAFGEAVQSAPAFAEAYYNRALVRLSLGATDGALDDLNRLARLAPDGHRPDVRRTRELLREGQHSPGVALGLGAVMPGGGQFYTGRPYAGAVLAAVAIAGYLVAQDEDIVMRTFTAQDPFGNDYTFERGVGEYPRRSLGFGMIATSLIGGAIEAYFQARRAQADVSDLSARVRRSLTPATASSGAARQPR